MLDHCKLTVQTLFFGCLVCLVVTSVVNADGRMFVLDMRNSSGLQGFRDAERACASRHARLASSAELRHAVVECFFSACTRGWLYGGTVGTTVCNVVGSVVKAVDVRTENATEDTAHLDAFCIKDKGVPCGDPPSFPNARLQRHSGYEMGDELLYTCVPGYVMPSGHSAFSLLCDSCGEWYGLVEICVKDETESHVDYEDKFIDSYGEAEHHTQRPEEAHGEVHEELHRVTNSEGISSQEQQETSFSVEVEDEHQDQHEEPDVQGEVIGRKYDSEERETEDERAVEHYIGHPTWEQGRREVVTTDVAAATEAPVSLLSQKHLFWFPSEAFQDEGHPVSTNPTTQTTQRASGAQSEESKENESQERYHHQHPVDHHDHEPDSYDDHDRDDPYDHDNSDHDNQDAHDDSHHDDQDDHDSHQDEDNHDDHGKHYTPAEADDLDRLDHHESHEDHDDHYDMGEHEENRDRIRYESQDYDDRDDTYDEHESYEDHKDVSDDREHPDVSKEHPKHDDDEEHYDTEEDDQHNDHDDHDHDDQDHDDHDHDDQDHDDHDHDDHDSHEDVDGGHQHVIFSIAADERQNVTQRGEGEATTDETWLDGYPVHPKETDNGGSTNQRVRPEDREGGAVVRTTDKPNEVEVRRPAPYTSLPEAPESASIEPVLEQGGTEEMWPGFIPTTAPSADHSQSQPSDFPSYFDTLDYDTQQVAPTRSWLEDLTEDPFLHHDLAPPVKDGDILMEEHTLHNLPGETGQRGEIEGEMGETICTGEDCPPPGSSSRGPTVAAIIVVVCAVAAAVIVGLWCYRRQQQKSSMYEMNGKGQSQTRQGQQIEMQQKV